MRRGEGGGETITPSWNWRSNSTIKRDVNLQSPKCQFDFKTTKILANQFQIQTKTQPEKISHPKLIVCNVVATRGVNNNISPEIKKEKICKARKTSYASYCKSTEKETHDEIPHYKETTNQASLCLQHRYVYIQCKYNPLINIFLVCAGQWIVMTPILAVKGPSKHLLVFKTSWRRLQDVLEANKMFTGDICI